VSGLVEPVPAISFFSALPSATLFAAVRRSIVWAIATPSNVPIGRQHVLALDQGIVVAFELVE
jgi:hypothetical protein